MVYPIFTKLRALSLFTLILLSGILLSSNVLAQEERILEYTTRIEVNTDRSIDVTETIRVNVQGNVFKRGITRYLPTKRYLNDKKVSVSYDIREVKRDEKKESYHTESQGNGIVMYLGSKNVFLKPGTYTYTIRYHVKDQIGFYEDYDEIYWNAVGTENQVSTDKAIAEVVLPKGVDMIQQAAYVGARGAKDEDFSYEKDGQVLRYETTRPLSPREGFTVAVGFEKGTMPTPGFFDKFGSTIVLIIAGIFLLPYYFYTWVRYGKDPPTPPSYPIWESPDDLSPASINYIQNGMYQNKSFTASIIHLAIKGYLRIEEEESKGWFSSKKHFRLIKEKDFTQDLPYEEQQLLADLFGSGNSVLIDGKYDRDIQRTSQGHRSSLGAQHSSFIWKGHNIQLMILPFLLTIGAFILAIVFLGNSYGETVNKYAVAAYLPIAFIIFGIYAYLIRKPTVKKVELRSRIKGFKMYLELAEKDRLRLLNPPDMTPEHFEEMLPFAFALGVEHKWTEKFKDILDRMQYQPRWSNTHSMIYFSNHFGRDFNQSFAGAATPPSKSGSGSGGGGFSGGGGGGGGVGGW